MTDDRLNHLRRILRVGAEVHAQRCCATNIGDVLSALSEALDEIERLRAVKEVRPSPELLAEIERTALRIRTGIRLEVVTIQVVHDPDPGGEPLFRRS